MLASHQAPKKWLREALCRIRASENMDRHAQALEARLQAALTSTEGMADLFIPYGRKQRRFDGNHSWIDVTLKEHQREPFDAVIAQDVKAHFSPNEADSTQPQYQARTALDVPQTAAALEEALRPLLRVSRHLHLVDPYFEPSKTRYQGTVRELLHRHLQIEDVLLQVSSQHMAGKTAADFGATLRTLALPSGVGITVQALKKQYGGPKLHHRYLMTDVAGVSVDPGLDTSSTSGDEFILNLMPLEQYITRQQQYRSELAFEVVDQFVFTT